ncbi:MAG UNVERIFIED_CONTAM: hypothetical protein LVT10_02085 [Anaerolineae bacterium]
MVHFIKEGAVEHIHQLARKYTEFDRYYGVCAVEREQQETRVIKSSQYGALYTLTKTLATESALILVDIQQGFDHPTHWGTRNNPQAEERIDAVPLSPAWRATSKRRVIHVHHHSDLSPESPLHPEPSTRHPLRSRVPNR